MFKHETHWWDWKNQTDWETLCNPWKIDCNALLVVKCNSWFMRQSCIWLWFNIFLSLLLLTLMQVFTVPLSCVFFCGNVTTALFLVNSLTFTPNYHLDFPWGALAEVNALDKQKFASLINLQIFLWHTIGIKGSCVSGSFSRLTGLFFLSTLLI